MKFPKTQVIAFVNQKGGCGKTSASVSTAAAFADLGYQACIVDTDPQCNATETFGVTQAALQKEGRYTLADGYLKKRPASDIHVGFGPRFDDKLFLVPGHKGLSSVGPRLEAQMQAELAAKEENSILDADDYRNEHRLRLKSSLESLRGLHDIVIIDTPPNLDFLMTTALIAADWFVIPIFPSGYDLSGLETLLKTVEKVRERYNQNLKLAGILLGNFDKSARLDREIHELLIAKFGAAYVFQTTISRSVKHREATLYQKTIFEHPEAGDQAAQYTDLAKEMLNRGERSRLKVSTEELSRRVVNG